MSHQPFENWILDHERLATADRRMLQAHLENCAQCRRLQQRWQSVHQELRIRRMAAPGPGFTQRWLASLAERRARAQRKQAWRVFGILLGSALFILLVLTTYLMATSSPTDWLNALIRTITSSTNLLYLGLSFARTWLANIPLAVNIALWIYLTITLCLLSGVWALVFWRAKFVGVHGK